MDFNDLMDTDQDAFPGFEIARFSPVTAKNDDSHKDDDSDLLKTPEHESRIYDDINDDDDEQIVENDSKNDENEDKESSKAEDQRVASHAETENLHNSKVSGDGREGMSEKKEDYNHSVNAKISDDESIDDDESDINNSNVDSAGVSIIDNLRNEENGCPKTSEVSDSEVVDADENDTNNSNVYTVEEGITDKTSDFGKNDLKKSEDIERDNAADGIEEINTGDDADDVEQNDEMEMKNTDNTSDSRKETEGNKEEDKAIDDQEGNANEDGAEENDSKDISIEGEDFTIEINEDDSDNGNNC